MGDMRLMLDDYRLTTAEIHYHMPDFPNLLQTFVWQRLDRVPELPHLRKFLSYWQRELEGRLHSVRVAYTGIVQPAEWRYTERHLTLH